MKSQSLCIWQLIKTQILQLSPWFTKYACSSATLSHNEDLKTTKQVIHDCVLVKMIQDSLIPFQAYLRLHKVFMCLCTHKITFKFAQHQINDCCKLFNEAINLNKCCIIWDLSMEWSYVLWTHQYHRINLPPHLQS